MQALVPVRRAGEQDCSLAQELLLWIELASRLPWSTSCCCCSCCCFCCCCYESEVYTTVYKRIHTSSKYHRWVLKLNLFLNQYHLLVYDRNLPISLDMKVWVTWFIQTLFQCQLDSALRDPDQTSMKGETGGDHLWWRHVVWRREKKIQQHWMRKRRWPNAKWRKYKNTHSQTWTICVFVHT